MFETSVATGTRRRVPPATKPDETLRWEAGTRLAVLRVMRISSPLLSVLLAATACGGGCDDSPEPSEPGGPGAELTALEPAAEPAEPEPPPAAGLHLLPRRGDPVTEEARARSRELNREGLRAHTRRDWATARARFESAAEADPNHGHARFNAACAAARGGDVAGARAHVEAFLTLEPGSAGRVLHDGDLAALRQQSGFDDWLRGKVRPSGAWVRSLVFERRENGGDLFVIDEDGLNERPLAADPEWREHKAAVTSDGRFVAYLASRFGDRPVPRRQLGEGHPQRDWSDVAQQGRLFDHRFDHELRIAPLEGGEHRVVGRRVHSYRVAEDGATVLFLDEETDDEFRVRSVATAGGEPTTLASVGAASTWCYAQRDDGALIVAEGSTHRWASGLQVRVVEYRDGAERELLARTEIRTNEPRVPDFQLCALSEDENELHFGLMRAVFLPSAHLEHVPELRLASGAYNFRRVGSRGTVARGEQTELFLTVVGETQQDTEDVETDSPSFSNWQTSPLTWVNDDGMGDPWWYETRIVAIDWQGSTRRFLSPERNSYEYGPSVDGETVALTRYRLGGEPWVIVSDREGDARRRVVPGQYPVWNPVPHRVD